MFILEILSYLCKKKFRRQIGNLQFCPGLMQRQTISMLANALLNQYTQVTKVILLHVGYEGLRRLYYYMQVKKAQVIYIDLVPLYNQCKYQCITQVLMLAQQTLRIGHINHVDTVNRPRKHCKIGLQSYKQKKGLGKLRIIFFVIYLFKQ